MGEVIFWNPEVSSVMISGAKWVQETCQLDFSHVSIFNRTVVKSLAFPNTLLKSQSAHSHSKF